MKRSEMPVSGSRAHLHDYAQFAPFGRLLPNDLDHLLEVIEELVQLSSKAADL